MRKVVGLVGLAGLAGLAGLVGNAYADLPTFESGQVLKAEDLNKIVEAINEINESKLRYGEFNANELCQLKNTERHRQRETTFHKFNGQTLDAVIYTYPTDSIGTTGGWYNEVNAKINGYDAGIRYSFVNWDNPAKPYISELRISIDIGNKEFVRVFDYNTYAAENVENPFPRDFAQGNETHIDYRNYAIQQAVNCFEVRG